MPERQRDARPAEALSASERMTRSFHLTCLAILIPYHQRCAALDAWLDVDRALFHPYDHRRDLLSTDTDVAAAALLEPRHGTGRAEWGGRPLPPPAPAAPATEPHRPDRTPWVPEWKPPGGTGPTAAPVARWASGHVAAGRRAALLPLLRHHPGTLPELLAAATGAHPDRPAG
ncbi:hypothetical protein [Streptomyces lavendulae]|uniref:hypothetical protein n=1 Tax=Streptomyces lavendulae TaxID=1914 RepID=UPI002555AC07|nr:hypothetical protein [Streptomyces lavendulae]